MSDSQQPKKANAFALAIATALVVLHTRRYRRNLLFGLTLGLLIMVFAGAVPFGDALMRYPIGFTIYWALCFLLLLAVLCLALYDMMRVRQEHRREMRKLDARLSEAVEELKRTAGDSSSSTSDGEGEEP